MELSGTFTHHTFSPILLVLFSIALSLVVGLLVRRKTKVGVIAAIGCSVLLVYIAGEHLPFVRSFAPRSFCFGDIGAVHIFSFALPLVAATLTRRREIAPVV